MDSGIERGYVSDKTIAGGWTKAFAICGEICCETQKKKGKI